MSFADKVYSRGAARCAAPLDRLLARYREFKRRTYRKWRNHVLAAEAAGAAILASGSGQPVRSSSLPEKWSDNLNFHSIVDLEALTKAAAAAAPPPAAAAPKQQQPEPIRSAPFSTADPLLAGGGVLVGGSSSSGPRSALGTISSASAARSYRTADGPEVAVDDNVRNVLVSSEQQQQVRASTSNFARAPARSSAAPFAPVASSSGGDSSKPTASTNDIAKNRGITIYQDDEENAAPPSSAAAKPALAAVASGSVSGSGSAVANTALSLSSRSGGLVPRALAPSTATAAPAVPSSDSHVVGISSSGGSTSEAAVAAVWKTLPGQVEVKKENTQEASKWTETALPVHAGVAPVPASRAVGARPAAASVKDARVTVWVDDDLPTTTPAAAPSASAVTKAAAPNTITAPAAAPTSTAVRLRELELPAAEEAPVTAASLLQAQRRNLAASASSSAAASAVPAQAVRPSAVTSASATASTAAVVRARQAIEAAPQQSKAQHSALAVESAKHAQATPSASLFAFLSADLRDEESWSVEERLAQGWMKRQPRAVIEDIATTSEQSVAARVRAEAEARAAAAATAAARSTDRTARLSSINELLSEGSSASDNIEMCTDDDDEAEAAPVQPVTRPAPPASSSIKTTAPAPFALYEDSFLVDNPPQQQQQQLQPPSRLAASKGPGYSTSSSNALFSSDISGIVTVANDDSIQPGAFAFVPLASSGIGQRFPQRPAQGQLSTIMEAPSALSHSSLGSTTSSSSSSSSSSSILSSIPSQAPSKAPAAASGGGGGGGFQIFQDESLVEGSAAQKGVAAAAMSLGDAKGKAAPSSRAIGIAVDDPENQRAPLPPSAVAGMLFEPKPRMLKPAPVPVVIQPQVAAAADEDVTINTRLALDDMDDMFASPSLKRARAKQQQQQQQQQQAIAAARPTGAPPLQIAQSAPVADSPPPPEPAAGAPVRRPGRGARAMSMGGATFALERLPPDARRLSMAIVAGRPGGQLGGRDSSPGARLKSTTLHVKSPPKSPVRIGIQATSPPSSRSSATASEQTIGVLLGRQSTLTSDRTARTEDLANLLGDSTTVDSISQPAADAVVDENEAPRGYARGGRAQHSSRPLAAIHPRSVTPLQPGEGEYIEVSYEQLPAARQQRGEPLESSAMDRFEVYRDC